MAIWSRVIRLTLGLLALCALISPRAFAADPGVSATEILIGMFSPLTGPQALIGTSERDGIELGMEEINKAGGIKGRKLRLIAYDDGASPQEALAAVRRLIDQDQVFALIAGSNSGATLAAMPLINRQRIPFIVSISSHRNLFVPFAPTTFRVYAMETPQAARIVEFSLKENKLTKPAMIHTSADHGLGGLEAVTEELKRNNLKLVAVERYNPDTQDFSAQLLRIREAGADGLYLWSLAHEAGIIVRQAKELGLNIPMFSGGASTTALFPKTAGAASVGVSAPWVFPYTEEMKEIPAIAAYRALLSTRYPNGYPPARPSLYDLAGYGALKILAEGISRIDGEPTRAKLVTALESMKNFDTGVLFPVTFTATDHEGSKDVSIITIDKDLTWKIRK
jgi:branched-chain amino acid transport system substrate-binding protein